MPAKKKERKAPAPKMTPVDQISVQAGETIESLVEKWANTGFTAKRIARACAIYWKMVSTPNCKKFFALAGAMVPVGMQQVIIDFIREGFIDVLVSTGANLTHDLAECLGFRHQQGHTATGQGQMKDGDLYDARMNRIYDVFMPNEVYESMEDFVKTLNLPKDVPVRELLKLLGKSLANQPRDSILKAAAEKNVPIFCPAFADSGLGMQIMFNKRGINPNHFDDLQEMINIAWDANPAGICIVGGGVPKNYIMQSMQFSPASAQYAIQITMDRPEPGGLSGAELREAISWGKVNKDAEFVDVICDATVALPIILAYLKSMKKKM